jgi:hypothetical protein
MMKAVIDDIDSFTAKRTRLLVPTLVKPAVIEQHASAAARRRFLRASGGTAKLSAFDLEELRREELLASLSVRWHDQKKEFESEEDFARPRYVHNGVMTIEDIHYRQYQKPLDIGPSKMAKWLLNLRALRNLDLVFALRERYTLKTIEPVPLTLDLLIAQLPGSFRRGNAQRSASIIRGLPATPQAKQQFLQFADPTFKKLRGLWLRHCKPNQTLTMPNGTVAFHAFLQDALPEGYFVDKRASEHMYRLLNDHRSSPLEYRTAFLKFIFILADLSECDAEAVLAFSKVFFSTVHEVWQLHTDFATVVDFQLIVTTFEDLVLGYEDSAKKASPHADTLKGMIHSLKEDILQGYAVKQPIRHYTHVGPALDRFAQSTFVQLLRDRVDQSTLGNLPDLEGSQPLTPTIPSAAMVPTAAANVIAGNDGTLYDKALFFKTSNGEVKRMPLMCRLLRAAGADDESIAARMPKEGTDKYIPKPPPPGTVSRSQWFLQVLANEAKALSTALSYDVRVGANQ